MVDINVALHNFLTYKSNGQSVWGTALSASLKWCWTWGTPNIQIPRGEFAMRIVGKIVRKHLSSRLTKLQVTFIKVDIVQFNFCELRCPAEQYRLHSTFQVKAGHGHAEATGMLCSSLRWSGSVRRPTAKVSQRTRWSNGIPQRFVRSLHGWFKIDYTIDHL